MELNQLLPDNLVSMPNHLDTEVTRRRNNSPELLIFSLGASRCSYIWLPSRHTNYILAYMATIVQTSLTYPIEAGLAVIWPPSEQLHTPTSLPTALKTPQKGGELCMGFNLGHCSVPLCARPHFCYHCRLSHPLLQCPRARGFLKGKFPVSSQSTKGSRTSSQQ